MGAAGIIPMSMSPGPQRVKSYRDKGKARDPLNRDTDVSGALGPGSERGDEPGIGGDRLRRSRGRRGWARARR